MSSSLKASLGDVRRLSLTALLATVTVAIPTQLTARAFDDSYVVWPALVGCLMTGAVAFAGARIDWVAVRAFAVVVDPSVSLRSA